MSDILHTIRIHAPRERVYAALATTDGLTKWWTRTTDGSSAPGEQIAFRFGENVIKMHVDSLEPVRRVAWTCVESPAEWVDTRVTFDLEPAGDATLLRFGHREWAQASDFYGHCSMKWATFLLSLKDLAEKDAGRPFPDDIAI